MTLEKAIRRLQRFIRWRKPDPKYNFVESVQLGIEALQRIQVGRNNPGSHWNDLLPGETKNQEGGGNELATG